MGSYKKFPPGDNTGWNEKQISCLVFLRYGILCGLAPQFHRQRVVVRASAETVDENVIEWLQVR